MKTLPQIDQFFEKWILSGNYWQRKLFFLLVIVIPSINFCLNLGYYVPFMKTFWKHAAFDHKEGFAGINGICCFFWDWLSYQTNDLLMLAVRVYDFDRPYNMRFRLWAPLLMKTLGFKYAYQMYLLQVGMGFVYVALLIGTVKQIVKDRLSVVYFCLGFCGLYAGMAYYADMRGYHDAWGFFFLLAALYFRNPVWVALAVFLGCWVDERVVFNMCFVFFFHAYYTDAPAKKILQIPFTKATFAIINGIILYLIIRFSLQFAYDIPTPTGQPTLFHHVRFGLKDIGLRMWGGMEGFWLLILLMITGFIVQKEKLKLLLMGSSALLCCFVVFMQADYVRTFSFSFPLFFVALSTLKNEFSTSQLRYLLLGIATLTLIYPMYF